MDTKYIFVTGGVVSSLGKGIISASIGKLLQARGYRITIQKFATSVTMSVLRALRQHATTASLQAVSTRLLSTVSVMVIIWARPFRWCRISRTR